MSSTHGLSRLPLTPSPAGTADTARADARLGIAVTRGLLLDLLATGNRAAVDAAMERYIVQYEAIQR